MSALVLGATSRVAHALAHALAARGHDVCVAARDLDEAERVAADVRVRSGHASVALRFDATDFDAHAAFIDSVEAAVGALDTVVLAFGEMGAQADSERNAQAARQVIDVNYTGAVSVCERVAERLISRKRGTIIGVSSVAGDRGRQSNYIYGSAKGAFTLYLQGLRNRLFPLGVHVLTVKLGFVDTRMTWGMSTRIPIAAPEAAAQAILSAAAGGEDVLYYPRFWRGVMTLIGAVPERVFKRLKL